MKLRRKIFLIFLIVLTAGFIFLIRRPTGLSDRHRMGRGVFKTIRD